jgi:ribonuclease Z
MKPLFQPQLINGPFDDPVLYLDFLFERRALLFDCGNLRALSTRKILRVSEVFVSHMHMDHFNDFDWILRLMLGRGKRLRMFGPRGFIDSLGHKLGAYTWNLVHNYEEDLVIEAIELHDGDCGERARFWCREGFRLRERRPCEFPGGVLVEEPAVRVRAAVLDHGTPVLAFVVEETQHVNVWKNHLEAMGLPVGPWLQDLKAMVLSGQPDAVPVRVWWKEGSELRERYVPLGELKHEVLRIVPGQRLGYVVDVAGHEDNARRLTALLRGIDLLFIETPFLDEDREHAADRHHLTARRAGEIAHAAGVKRLEPFHFSPRYNEREAELRAEAERAFSAGKEYARRPSAVSS